MRVCAITNVYNEAFNLPIWLRHYGRHVGPKNCVVIDHASDDGSTEDVGAASRINMPRDKFSDGSRAAFISEFASAMLRLYDAVIYSDCDELLVPDPAKYTGLLDFCEKMARPCATAIGLNLIQDIATESLINPSEQILGQRSFVQFVSPMCKSLIIRERVIWTGGFHGSSLMPSFFDLFLFHIRWVDIAQCLRRLNTTQKIAFENDGPTHHHSPISDYLEQFQIAAKKTKRDDFEYRPFVEKVAAWFKETPNGRFIIDGDYRSPELFRVPERFRSAF